MSAEIQSNRATMSSHTSTDIEVCPLETEVFVHGQDGRPDYCYRIPSMVISRQGVVLAFCEARHGEHGDHAQNDIVLKRSFDAGRTWTPLQVVADHGDHSLNNVVSVMVRETGRIIIMFQSYPHGVHHSAKPQKQLVGVEEGYEGECIARTYVMTSDDEGASWSEARDMTRSVKRPVGTTATLSGPGAAIQLRRGPHQGRIVVPFYEYPAPNHVYAVFSDDQGETWSCGDVAENLSEGAGNECQMVELIDGSIMVNSRRSGPGAARRKIGISKDGGQTWSGLVDDPTLIGPGCQGSIFRYSDPLDGHRSRILFCNPASERDRRDGTLRLSYDEAKTWPVSKRVNDHNYAGYNGRHNFCYSCLGRLPDMRIACLYEAVKEKHTTITFASFTLAWLTDGADIGSDLSQHRVVE